MDIKKNNKLIVTSIIFYLIIFFTLVLTVLPNYSTLINGIFILALNVSVFMIYKYKKPEFNSLEKKIIRLVFFSIFMFFTIIYLLGILTGYGRSVFSTNFTSIIKNTLIPLVSVILLELFRYMYITNNKDSKKNIKVITFLIILLDIALNVYKFDLTLSNIFVFLTVTVLPIIFKNIMLSYITKNVNYTPCLIYVIPLCLYKYVVTFKPMLGNYLTSVVSIALPAFIYVYSSRIISNDKVDHISVGRICRIIFLDIPLTLFLTVFIGLISGYFKYHLIGVESSSIAGIDRGDAIMIDKSYLYTKYKKGDIIAYKDGNKNVIAKISKIETDTSGYRTIYKTKVINTITKDEYEKIDKKSILGKYVDFKIKYIATPTVWFKKNVANMN